MFQVSSIYSFIPRGGNTKLVDPILDESTAQVEPSTNEVLVDLLRPEFYKDTDQAHPWLMLGLLVVGSYWFIDVDIWII